MYAKIEITDNDIKYAENILFGGKNVFDDERKIFIRNLESIDLQAVPGSGKTTALLAKLLILEKYLPFNDCSGILVLSHTNTAVDEIKNRIEKYCPKLFSYPNFVGTIQSFVDTFLAIPFYVNRFKIKPYRIDNEIYDENVERFYDHNNNYKLRKYLKNQYNGLDFLKSIRITKDGKNLKSGINGKIKEFRLKDPKKPVYKALINFKKKLIKDGILHYEDAYMLAENQLTKYPHAKILLRKRFKYVFVDEMQDMDLHQYELLESLFFDNVSSKAIYQRIGDKNQAIYSYEVKLDDIWQQRNIKNIEGSQRLSPQIANVVEKLSLTNNKIIGLNKKVNIKPHIIVFDNKNIGQVIPKFAELIKKYQEEDKIPYNPKYKFMAIGWVKTQKDDGKLTVPSYWKNYQVSISKKNIDFKVLKDYLIFIEKGNNSLNHIRDNILNAFLKVTRLENILDENGRNYTERKLLSYLNENNQKAYEEFQLNIYKWSIDLVRPRVEEVYQSIKSFIPEFLKYFHKKIEKSNEFINGNSITNIQDTNMEYEFNVLKQNVFSLDNIKIEIGTVHSAKGQTHTATLYLETFYQGEYESEYLKEIFLKCSVFTANNIHQKHASKMAYVGFSRPTHLLCVAIHKGRYEENLADKIDNGVWEILDIGEDNNVQSN